MLKTFWVKFKEISFFIGNLISGIFLFIFYYTIFAVFALLFKLFSNPLAVKSGKSNWLVRGKTFFAMEDFKNE